VSPISKRTGKRYAAGSSASRDGYTDVLTCATCTEKLVLSRQTIQYETDLRVRPPLRRGWHASCGRPVPT
jgi:hypothetical protein